MNLTIAILFSCLSCSALPIREALSQIESGSNDRAKGRAGERSRFQIMPAVWRQHSATRNYQDANHAWNVTRRILAPRCLAFRVATGRQPDHKELYAAWNAPMAFRRSGYRIERMSGKVRERAQRFENLVQSK